MREPDEAVDGEDRERRENEVQDDDRGECHGSTVPALDENMLRGG
jgi:hypothetical protein